MFTIGDFATMGRVSVRMLRHYDAIGLLEPSAVHPDSGYRLYSAAQLPRLNRIVALRGLGFSLDEIGVVLSDAIDVGELHGMFRLRQIELERGIDRDRQRLATVAARLRIIEREASMSPTSITTRPMPAWHVASLTGTAASTEPDDVGPVIQGLFERVAGAVSGADIAAAGPGVAVYRTLEDGRLECRAGLAVDPDVSSVPDCEVVELPAVESAAVYVFEGDPVGIGDAYQALAVWLEDNGHQTDGTARETTVVGPPKPPAEWVTEVAVPIIGR